MGAKRNNRDTLFNITYKNHEGGLYLSDLEQRRSCFNELVYHPWFLQKVPQSISKIGFHKPW